jgi:hypothetical protein
MHCGWNSTLESLVSGVLVMAFPQWSDRSRDKREADRRCVEDGSEGDCK